MNIYVVDKGVRIPRDDTQEHAIAFSYCSIFVVAFHDPLQKLSEICFNNFIFFFWAKLKNLL